MDVQAAYCRHPSKTLLRQDAGRMSLYRDPRAPVQLSPEEKQEVKRDPEIQSLIEHCKTLEIKCNWKRHTGDKAKAQAGLDRQELTKAKALLRSEIAHKERALFKAVRTKYFKSIGTIELKRQSCIEDGDKDVDQDSIPEPLRYTFEERQRLTHLLFKALDPMKESRSVILDIRLRAISELTALCSRREIKRGDASTTAVDNMLNPIEFEDPVSRLEESHQISTLKALRLECGRICLVCCGDLHLSDDDRIKTYKRKDTLQKHFERWHSDSIHERNTSWCGHPACSGTVVQNITLFKNHAAMVHKIIM